MALKKKINNLTNTEKYFVVSVEKKKKILGIFLLVISLLLFLSIISYSSKDQANPPLQLKDFVRVFSPDPSFAKQIDETQNWLSVFGAYISNFFVNATLGFSSIVFPIIIFIWSFEILRKNKNTKFALSLSNFLIIAAILIATLFGVLRFKLNVFSSLNELSGNAGGFLGLTLSRLLGGLGSLILLSTLILITLIIAIDLKLSRLLEFFKSLFEKDETKLSAEERQSKSEKNLSKIKELKEDKPKRTRLMKFKNDEAEAAEQGEETKIRIVRSEEPKTVEEKVEEKDVKSEQKKEDKKKTDTQSIQEIDKDIEARLPNQWDEIINYKKPPITLLDPAPEENYKVAEEELKKNAELLKEKLSLFDIKIEDITVTPGPVVTLYEIVPEPGVKISRIVSLEHDIALALAARGIRIIAPIPGKSAIGVEIPNAEAALVNARSVLSKSGEIKDELPLAIGKTIVGDVLITDLAKMPHLLIAGSTGSGKSVGINMIICSLLFSKDPSDVKFVIIDPKKIELSFYQKLNKHFLAVSPDLDEEIITTPQNSVLVLKSVEYEMEKRYNRLAKAGVRNIVDYNQKVADPKRRPKDTDEVQHYKMPYIIVIIDELADLMITASKEVEEPIARLAQLARAVGIHLVLATQRPSVNVITGVIKANFSARMAYQVATKVDSRTILDMNGAEQLLGRGDMLFLPSGTPKPIRVQNAFISTEEVERITNHIYSQPGYSKRYFLPSLYEKKKESEGGFLADRDPMFDDAAKVIVRHQQGSVSLLQRRLKLGYSRAARIVDQLEEAGIVGPADGSKVRSVLVDDEQQLETILRSL
ncbi:MAG: DNA translocase FtsK 4TM domain-containing protein [Ignavibacteriales bacterium]|nr:DNA translocase FtsK 4TM domain-containing protein [Ignavibacteriales bacterium]